VKSEEAADATGTVAGSAIDERCLRAARAGELVVFLGAGASVLPPTSLPSWTEINKAVLHSLCQRAALLSHADKTAGSGRDEADGASTADSNETAVWQALSRNELPPEYFSEVLVNRLGNLYFHVLSVLDSATPNAVHDAVAALAKSGCVRAIVSTNFDLCAEAALDNAGVKYVTWRVESDYLPEQCTIEAVGRMEDKLRSPVIVLKVHGSADLATSVVDTLSQRSLGLPDNVNGSLENLLCDRHWLVLGYSGADLAAAPNYLMLRSTMAEVHSPELYSFYPSLCARMCVYMCLCACVCVRACVCVHMFVLAYVCMCVFVCLCVCVRAFVCVCLCARM